MHPIVAIGVLVPSVAITLMLCRNERLNALIELLLIVWFTFFIVANVNFRNLTPRITIFQISNQESSEFKRLYSQVVKIYGDLFFGVSLIIFILAFLIAIGGEDFVISWLIIRARKK